MCIPKLQTACTSFFTYSTAKRPDMFFIPFMECEDSLTVLTNHDFTYEICWEIEMAIKKLPSNRINKFMYPLQFPLNCCMHQCKFCKIIKKRQVQHRNMAHSLSHTLTLNQVQRSRISSLHHSIIYELYFKLFVSVLG
jgi:hypothetical protein